MKRLSLLLFAYLAVSLSGMAQTVITYSYDAAGNRTTRTSSSDAVVADESQTHGESDIHDNSQVTQN